MKSMQNIEKQTGPMDSANPSARSVLGEFSIKMLGQWLPGIFR